MQKFPLIAFVVLILGTLGVGIVHGRLSNRWGLQPNAELAAERMRPALPEAVGNWRVRSDTKLADGVAKILQCSGYVHRIYEHQQTGDIVTVAVLLGPPGPISVHTPEVCYSSREYTPDGERRKTVITDETKREHTLWQLPLNANNLDASSLRVFYGWTTGTTWEAVEHPRFCFGGLPHLYKLQVAVTDHPASTAINFDAGQDFLACFLPQIQSRLVEATRGRTAPSK